MSWIFVYTSFRDIGIPDIVGNPKLPHTLNQMFLNCNVIRCVKSIFIADDTTNIYFLSKKD